MRLLPVVALVCLAAESRVPLDQIANVERSIDGRVRDLWSDNPFVLLGPTRGMYLEAYGVVFSSEVNLATGPTMTIARVPISPQLVAAHRAKKLERLPQLRRSMKEALVNAANYLETLPAQEQIVIGVNLSRYPWEDTTGLPAQMILQATRAKVLYSASGIYVLTDAEDARICCTLREDFADLFREDVIEVFFWTDERHPVYFEYEISPLNFELPILVAHDNGRFHGWRPWHYTGQRRTRHATRVTTRGWTTEFFIPFALLVGLGRSHPRPGDQWRANIYRIDTDEAPASHWAWSPATGSNFHDYRNFGAFRFG